MERGVRGSRSVCRHLGVDTECVAPLPVVMISARLPARTVVQMLFIDSA